MAALADAILVVHALFVLFVVGSALYVWLGAVWQWPGIRNLVFRALHLAAIAFVAIEALLGYACPLTVWEDRLRGVGGEPAFIARWLQRAIYYDFPPWVFVIVYVAFALAIACTWYAIPPRRRGSR